MTFGLQDTRNDPVREPSFEYTGPGLLGPDDPDKVDRIPRKQALFGLHQIPDSGVLTGIGQQELHSVFSTESFAQ